MVAARSDRTKFNIDDVTIEFSFGWFDCELDDYKREKFILYFFNGHDSNYIVGQLSPYDLTNNMDKGEFIREILPNQFISEKYELTTSWRKGKEFAHSEMMTIPTNIFSNYIPGGRGVVIFMLADIIDIDGVYSAIDTAMIRLEYQFVNENTIKIIT